MFLVLDDNNTMINLDQCVSITKESINGKPVIFIQYPWDDMKHCSNKFVLHFDTNEFRDVTWQYIIDHYEHGAHLIPLKFHEMEHEVKQE